MTPLTLFAHTLAVLFEVSVATQSASGLAALGVIVLSGAAIVVATLLAVRAAAALLGMLSPERAVEPPPIPFLRTQDDPTAEGHPRPRAPGLATSVAVR
ncbi:MAG TPA: DUF6412 domain-containing protein [Microbacterium sp.]|uniref:DUF6412 domain-containing protein n=1 Tax=Microbacterium sp. TaxID=51671 RepID=UPI002BC3A4C6|nr:DUF6412 domain-containing protein [Microbacterium sp.]HWI31023.1 DUF6412 domain-containing protein [Microbacterium sp.]